MQNRGYNCYVHNKAALAFSVQWVTFRSLHHILRYKFHMSADLIIQHNRGDLVLASEI